MEAAKFNENPAAPYYDTYGDESSRPLQPAGPPPQMERRCELGLVWEGGQPGGRDSFGTLLRAGLAEAIGMLLFLFNGVTVVRFIQAGDDPALTSSSLLVIAFTFGISIFALVYLLADASGAHLNPAVSMGLVVGKRITVERFVIYVVSQCVGAVIGASVATMFLDGTAGAFNAVAPGISVRAAFCGEILSTFLLVVIVLAATDGTLGRKVGHIAPLTPLAIGLAVFIGHLVLVPVDGCSINPARSFATAFTNGYWGNHWVFWCGPMLGGALATAVWESVLRPEQPVGMPKGTPPAPV